MKYLYGLGAAIVIAGALFKIQHYPGAGLMLLVGMGTEAFIFVCSAFEPLPHADPQWELVYPELAGGEHGAVREPRQVASSAAPVAIGEGGTALAAAINSANLGALNVEQLNVEQLTLGLSKLGKTTEKLNALSETSVAANALSEKLQQASITMGNFTQSYEGSSQVLSESMSGLTDSYRSAAQSVSEAGKQVGEEVNKSGKQMVEVIGNAAESFATTFTLIDQQIKNNLDNIRQGNGAYHEQVEELNKNLAVLNTVYTLQAQETSGYYKRTTTMGQQLEKLVAEMQASTKEYQELYKGIGQFNEHVAALNVIYGNMLSTAQLVSKKR
jgi:gliding motility-associated protein GldL